MSKAAASPPSGWLNRKTLVYITVAVVVIAVGLAIHFANSGAISCLVSALREGSSEALPLRTRS